MVLSLASLVPVTSIWKAMGHAQLTSALVNMELPSPTATVYRTVQTSVPAVLIFTI